MRRDIPFGWNCRCRKSWFSFLFGFGEFGKMLSSDGVCIVGVDLLLM